MKLKGRMSFVITISLLLIVFSNIVVLAQDTSAVACTSYQQAPSLDADVASGNLPAVADRLPKHPVVDAPAEGIGMYGGDLPGQYGGQRLAEFRQYGYENLVRWNPAGTEVIPNIAESWDINNGAKEYVFHLREGLKWSDGQPFTADDILFWWTDVETDPDINPGGPHPYFVVAGENATVKEIDPLTISFSWSQPNGLFLQNLSASYGVRVTQFAKHYLEQFSKQSSPDNVAKLMAADSSTSYGDWWTNHVGSYGNPAEYNDPMRPLMQPWIPQAPYIGEAQFTFVRNPYYFKVDPSCNQLPYIDTRTWTLVTDPQVSLLQTLGGQNFISSEDISQPQNKAVFFDNQETGNYRFIDVINSNFNTMLLHLNFTHPDPIKAQVFNDKNFRIGLSQAMDRQTVIDTVYVGQGQPYQAAPRPDSPFYNEQLATQYTDYSVEAANATLDKVLPNKGGDGYRLGPDGNPFSFTVTIDQGFRTDWVDVMQIVQKDWQAVGLDVKLDVVSDDTMQTRTQQPDLDATVWAGENGTGQIPMLAISQQTSDFLPTNTDQSLSAGWWAWDLKQQDANAETQYEPVTPPESVQRMLEISHQIKLAATPEDQNKLMTEYFNLDADTFYTIGLSLPAGDYQVFSNTLRNVPDSVIHGWLYPGPSPVNFETFYIDPSMAKP